MYKEGDLIKLCFETQQRLGIVTWQERWLSCPYVIVYQDQEWSDLVRIIGKVYHEDGRVHTVTPIHVYAENSKLIERQDND